LASDFNDDPAAGPPEKPPETPVAADPPAAAPAAPTAAQSPALTRFRSCRWQQPAENGSAEFCTHREVKPYAGTTGFDADAWCPDCQHYKLRRAPKKKSPSDDYMY
jgi:hypothetical protein